MGANQIVVGETAVSVAQLEIHKERCRELLQGHPAG